MKLSRFLKEPIAVLGVGAEVTDCGLGSCKRSALSILASSSNGGRFPWEGGSGPSGARNLESGWSKKEKSEMRSIFEGILPIKLAGKTGSTGKHDKNGPFVDGAARGFRTSGATKLEEPACWPYRGSVLEDMIIAPALPPTREAGLF